MSFKVKSHTTYKVWPKKQVARLGRVPKKPEGESLVNSWFNRQAGIRKSKAKKSIENDFIRVGNEFIDKKLICITLHELVTMRNNHITNGEAREIIGKYEQNGEAEYWSNGGSWNETARWNLTPKGFKKHGFNWLVN